MSSKIHCGEVKPGSMVSICEKFIEFPNVIFWRKKNIEPGKLSAGRGSSLYEISTTPNFSPHETTLCVGDDYILQRATPFPAGDEIVPHLTAYLNEVRATPCECLQKMAVDIRLTSGAKWVFPPSHDWEKGVSEIEFQLLSEGNTLKSVKIPARFCPLCGKKYT